MEILRNLDNVALMSDILKLCHNINPDLIKAIEEQTGDVSKISDAEDLLREVMKNGKVVDILDNGVSSQGNQSYGYIIDAGKKIGTKDETHVKVILSDDGGIITAYPFNIEGGMRK